ncbi:MAG: LTA synthase family protein [Myxococcota bacterium]
MDAREASDRSDKALMKSALEGILFTILLVGTESAAISDLNDSGRAAASLPWLLVGPLLLVALSSLLPNRSRRLFLGSCGVLATLIFAGDEAYHRFFGTVTSAFMISSIDQLVAVRTSVTSLISGWDLLPALLYSPFFIVAVRPDLAWPRANADANASAQLSTPTFRIRLVSALGIALVAGGLFAIASRIPIHEPTHHLGRSEWIAPSEHWGSEYSRLTKARTFGLLNYHVGDLYSFASSHFGRESLAPDAQQRIAETTRDRQEMNRLGSPAFGIARGRHVILVQLESFQHFLLDLEVGGHEVTPNLNRFRREGLSWDYVMDVTHIGRTSDAEFAVMTGLVPDFRKPSAFHHLSDELVTLPKTLKEIGYETTSIHGFEKSFWNRAESHPVFGIDTMRFGESFDDSDVIGLGPSDKQVFGFASQYLDQHRDKAQMIFLISLTSHHPYVYAPREYLKPFSHLDPRAGYGLAPAYLASASYADEALGLLLSDLEKNDLLNDSMIVIYGDHDRGGLGEKLPIPEIGERMFSPTEDRVPLVILIPGEEEATQALSATYSTTMGGLHDLFPTILHLLGEAPALGPWGTHLFVKNDERPSIPLAGPAGYFGHRGVLSLGNGEIVIPQSTPEAPVMPSTESIIRLRQDSEGYLDHYRELIAGGEIQGPTPSSRMADTR